MKVHKKFLVEALEKALPDGEYADLNLDEVADFSFRETIIMLVWVKGIIFSERLNDADKVKLIQDNINNYKKFITKEETPEQKAQWENFLKTGEITVDTE